jgi:DNA-binding response OmpR family regulator
VLLLEDDIALRGLLEDALRTEGLTVFTFDSFEALRSAARAKQADVIVADFWGVSQRTLNETGRREIQELNELLPVILLTGRTWAENATARDLGAQALVRKPFDLDDLLTEIERVLNETSDR